MKNIFLIILSCSFIIACQPNQKNQNESIKPSVFPLSNLDTNGSPCQDFYQYAIGGWLKDNPIPPSESRWSSFNVVNDSNNLKLKAILNTFSKGNYEKGSMEQQVGDFFLSIMDSTKAERLGLSPLKEELDLIQEINSKEDLPSILAHHKSIGVNSTFGLYVGQDSKNSEQYITYLSQSGIGLPDRDYYLKTDSQSIELQEQYRAHIQKIFDQAGEGQSLRKSETAYGIEKLLAESSMSRVDRRDPHKTYNKFDFAALKDLSSEMNWDLFFKEVGIDSVGELVVRQPKFIQKTNQLLDSIALEDWKIYLKWRLLNTYANDLSSEFEQEHFNFYGKTLSGTKTIKPRWKRALNKLNGSIGQLVGKAFVERHFSVEAKENVKEMVKTIAQVFEERLQSIDWMSEKTKKRALEKLSTFKMKIGYPDKWRDYSGLSITADEQIRNIMASKKFNFNYMISKLGKPIDKEEWFMNPHQVNAYYSSSKNEIVFPAGILQPPFYSIRADQAINYGGIGAVIGHEFSHGFDDQGSKYDAYGNLSNWWTEDDRKRFEEKTVRLVEQYNGFEAMEGVFVNGELTLGENIADLGGATMAFHALEKDVTPEEKRSKIDGFTYKQRFFLGWAQVWHMNMTPEELKKRINTDPHSPGKYRVNGTLANMKEFQEAFSCKEGDPMVQSDSIKAIIW